MDITAYGEYGDDIDPGAIGDNCFVLNWNGGK